MPVSLVVSAALALAPVSGDFDRDGLADRAYLREAAGGYEIVVERGSGDSAVVHAVTDSAHLYIGTLAPGIYETACGKGLGPRRAPCLERSVDLDGPTLEFGTEEASQAIVLWDGARFRVVWLSD